MRTAVLFCLAPLVGLIGCAAKPRQPDPNQRFTIASELPMPFPARPAPGLAVQRRTGTVSRANAVESVTDEFSDLRRIERLGNSQLKVDFKTEWLKSDRTKSGKHAVFADTTILPSAKLSLKVDCSTKKIVEKSGFQEALGRIEAAKPPGDEQDFLVTSLTNLIEHAGDLCRTMEGPFDLQKVEGKAPGYRWQEDVPIQGLSASKMDARFLGWHEKGADAFAVLFGQLDSEGTIPDSDGIKAHVKIESYLLVSSDWKKMVTDAATSQSVSAPGKPPYSGTIKIDVVSEQLPLDSF